MRNLTPEERVRLNFLYDLLDLGYRGLREASQIQRAAILHGQLTATLTADIHLMALSKANTAAWTEIQQILNPPAAADAAEAVTEAPDPDAKPAPKEWKQ